jgi:hypothetical protein
MMREKNHQKADRKRDERDWNGKKSAITGR